MKNVFKILTLLFISISNSPPKRSNFAAAFLSPLEPESDQTVYNKETMQKFFLEQMSLCAEQNCELERTKTENKSLAEQLMQAKKHNDEVTKKLTQQQKDKNTVINSKIEELKALIHQQTLTIEHQKKEITKQERKNTTMTDKLSQMNKSQEEQKRQIITSQLQEQKLREQIETLEINIQTSTILLKSAILQRNNLTSNHFQATFNRAPYVPTIIQELQTNYSFIMLELDKLPDLFKKNKTY